MKLSSAELLASEPLLGGQYMSSPPLNSKTSAFGGAGDMAGSMYSPILKASLGKSEHGVSRIHCIPLLMFFVFFILWAASSEVLPEVRMATTSDLGTSDLELKMVSENESDSHSGGRTVLQLHGSSHHGAASFRNTLPEKAHLRGNGRSDTGR